MALEKIELDISISKEKIRDLQFSVTSLLKDCKTFDQLTAIITVIFEKINEPLVYASEENKHARAACINGVMNGFAICIATFDLDEETLDAMLSELKPVIEQQKEQITSLDN